MALLGQVGEINEKGFYFTILENPLLGGNIYIYICINKDWLIEYVNAWLSLLVYGLF